MDFNSSLVTLFEVSWEVCNKVGGIHSVVTSKALQAVEHFGEDYDPATLPEAWLKAESPDYDSIYLKDGQTFEVFAVVTWNLKNLMA